MSAVFKQEARKLIDQLPESADWSDLIYRAALHASIERGKVDIAVDRAVTLEYLLQEFGIVE